ncbi:hypothetical protein NM213_27115 [Pseudomonas lactis]|uniref:hypothetical protein n=1 Tax=Pseudomonas lactis TaxID=1615674 RepID=UPI00054B1B2A|nr:hypothetical protein [Pseudomonas lactis]MDR8373562.1 hypothetical protein [Pseudomonas lactis]
MENLTVIREREISHTAVADFSAVYVGDARRPLAEARICASILPDRIKPKFLLIDIGRQADQNTWKTVMAAVQVQAKRSG